MSDYHFDQPIERRSTDSIKWTAYPPDVLPLWVADMDFQSPPAVMEALQRRVAEGVFGYGFDNRRLRELIVERMAQRYGWTIQAQDILFSPGMVVALNLVTQVVGKPGDAVLMQTPVYHPFLSVPGHQGRFAQTVDMVYTPTGEQTFSYEIDFEAFEAAISPQTSLFFLCNPHNPSGRAFTRPELERIAEICQRRNIIIAADEIHSDLMLDGTAHIPIASLSPEIAARTVTMIAPSKTFNIPGLATSILIVTDEALRNRIMAAGWGMGLHPNVLGLVAAEAAYEHGEAWLSAVLAYIQANRDYQVAFVRQHLPSVLSTVPQATYLSLLDCRNLPIPSGVSVGDFFLKEAKVALNNGAMFGRAADGFVRVNLATQRATLQTALERMVAAVQALV